MKSRKGFWIIEGNRIILLNNDFEKEGEVKIENIRGI